MIDVNKHKVLKVVVIGMYIIAFIFIAWFIISAIIAFNTNKEVEKVKQSYEMIIEQIETPIIVINENKVELLEVCDDSTFKSWLDYRSITSRNSLQYKLQGLAETNSLTGIRMLENRYLVALTGIYGDVGDKLDVKLESGVLLEVMIGDVKSVGHDYCRSNNDGSIIEFIVDKNEIDDVVRVSGNFNKIFKGKILEIRKVS